LSGIRLELVDYATGVVLRSSSGNNSETMERKTWDVTSYYLKYAFIRAVDNETGGWGHLNFDDIKFVY
jgi:fructan beta-fructosidase